MKLYYHPVSTTCRPIMMLAADMGLELDYKSVDLFTGEHMQDAYAAINPCRQVPMLEDGDFKLTESSAILKYLAEVTKSPAYPADPKLRARINERMDFLNTGLYRDLNYGLIYPQLMTHLRHSDDSVHNASLDWNSDKARRWLTLLDQTMLGPDNAYLCGDQLTIADYMGVAMLTVGEVVHLDYSKYPNICRWIGNMKAQPNWDKVNEAFYKYFVGPFKDKEFRGL